MEAVDSARIATAKRRLSEAVRQRDALRRELKRQRKRLARLYQDKFFLCERILKKKKARKKKAKEEGRSLLMCNQNKQ